MKEDEDFTPLAMFELGVEGLTNYFRTQAEKVEYVEQLEIRRLGVEADLKAMQRQKLPEDEINNFEMRFQKANGKFLSLARELS